MTISLESVKVCRNNCSYYYLKIQIVNLIQQYSLNAFYIISGVLWLKSKNNIEGKLAGNSTFSKCFSLLDNQKFLNQNYKPQQMDQLQPNLLNPSDPECLEVSGGSRRGSFRSSFRRSGENKPGTHDIHKPGTHDIHKSGTHDIHNQKSQNNPKHLSSNIQSSNIAQRAALTPNNIDCYSLEVPITQQVVTAPMSAAPHLHRANVSSPREKVPHKIQSHVINIQPQTPKKHNLHYATLQNGKTIEPQIAQIETKLLSSEMHNKDFFSKDMEADTDYFEYYTNQDELNYEDYSNFQIDEHQRIENEVLESKTARHEERRRSVPSIMTSKPVAPSMPSTTQYQKTPYDIVHSSEILNSTTSVYIIENGMRKRVKADESVQPRQPPLSPKSKFVFL